MIKIDQIALFIIMTALLLIPIWPEEIHEAAQKGDLEKVRELLRQNPVLIDARDEFERTPLHWAVRGVHFELMRLLIEKGADINAKDNARITPLHSIASRGHRQAAELLIAKGADLTAVDATSNTPLSYAVSGGHKELVKLFMDHGVKTPLQGEEARKMLHLAASSGYQEFVDFMIEKGADKNLKNDDGGTLLHSAAQSGNREFVKSLVEKGANVNEKDRYGITPLHIAAFCGHEEIARLLLNSRADIDAKNKISWTALSFAEFANKKEMIELLIERGAGRKPLHFTDFQGEYLGQKRPGLVPEPFAQGILRPLMSLQSAPSFAPDGKYLFFVSQRNSGAGDAFWVDADIIEELKPDEKEPKNGDSQLDNPAVCLHYLGHSSFVLEFDNGITILTDYGKSHSYGLDSRIFGLGELKPDVVTYSHQHEDHAGGAVPAGISHVLKEGESLNLKGINIEPVPTYERSLERPDNFSYLFSYKGIKILHMGDCQGLIMGLKRQEIRARIKKMYPGVYDLVLLPIGFVTDVVHPAAEFATLLRTEKLIPMHYWSKEEKERFLSLMRDKKSGAGVAHEVVDFKSARLCLDLSSGDNLPVKVIGLNAAPYIEKNKFN